MKKTTQLTNIELWEIISKEYVGTNEIMLIARCGKNKAQELRKEIEDKCKDYLLPSYKVPTKILLKKLNIDINKVFQKAKMEMELKTGYIK